MDTRKVAVLLGAYDLGPGINTYYPLDEGSGVLVKDHSQYDNDGILKNGPVWGLVDGVMGLTFDGVNDYIEDSKGRHIVKEGTTGFWSEVKIGDETKIVGSGTIFYFSDVGEDLEGQFVTDFADYCRNLTYLYCKENSFSGTLPDFSACTSLVNFYCHTNSFSGVLPSFSACTSLAYFRCENNSFTGTLPTFAACTSLVTFYCSYNSFSGTLPSFAACTNLSYFNCYANSFSGYASGGFATQISLATLDASSNAITAAADINAILADLRTSYDLVGRVACTVKLEGGTNAAPTGQGVTDKNFLNANGWTVTTN